jgi:hypothetical protein
MNTNELWKSVEDEAGIERIAIPLIAAFLWRRDHNSVPVAWSINKTCPVSDKLMTVGIFSGPDEMRVYALAVAKEGVNPKDAQPPTRMILTKDSNTLIPMIQEIMPIEVFIDELVGELITLGGVDDDDEEEESAVVAPAPNGSVVDSSPVAPNHVEVVE